MQIAHVVPLRRLPADRPWFDYLVEPGLSLHRGQLVAIPFGRQELSGIVWKLSDQSAMTVLKPLSHILRADPVMTEWQQETIAALAAWYFVSLGHFVNSLIPDWPKKLIDQAPTPPPPLRWRPAPVLHDRLWWYRDRRTAQDLVLDWLLKDDRSRLVCTPTVEDMREFVSLLGPDRVHVGVVDSTLGEREYRLLYEGVRTGRIKKVIGTGRALLLPWPTAPAILLDQDDHPAHRQSEQHPRLDNRQSVDIIAPQAIITTAAPSVYTFNRRHPQVPAFQGQRQLAVLGQPGSRDWLTPDAEELIHQTLQQGQSLLAIVPHHGFAQRVVCRECGWSLTCPQCGSRIRLHRLNAHQAVCQTCGHHVPVPISCPRCSSTRWNFSGLGIEQFIETLRGRWPKVLVQSADEIVDDRPSIIVGTYQASRQRLHPAPTRPVLIVSGDALLSYPDYAVAERAWTYLARVQAARADSAVMVQTYEPHLPFWQRWRHGDDRSWYADELRQRQTLALPPLAEHWLVRIPKGTNNLLEKKYAEVQQQLRQGVTVTLVAQTSGWPSRGHGGHLLIQAPAGIPLRDTLPWLELFPPPWQIDPAIRGWSD